MHLRNLIAALVLVLTPILAHADSFTYNLNDAFPGFSVMGTITTDTDSGVLMNSDITGYDLVLNDGVDALSLMPTNSAFDVGGSSVTATASGLFFNFDNTNGDYLIFQAPSLNAGNNYLCYQGVSGGCADFDGAKESVWIDGEGQIAQPLSGNRMIASTSIAETPEPESLVLLGTGLIGLVGVVRRRVLS